MTRRHRLITVLFVLSASLAIGCSGMFPDQSLAKAETEGRLTIGMPMSEVVQIVGRQPSTFSDVYTTSRTASGTRTVWIPGGRGTNSNLMHTYRLVFDEHGTLAEIERQ